MTGCSLDGFGRLCRVLAAGWLTGLAFGPGVAQSRQEAPAPLTHDETVFTPAEIARIDALGPWPPAGAHAWRPDPSNRASGDAAAIDFGRRLFFDARLSGRGTHSCSSCHRPEAAWSDALPLARGIAVSKRNTPSLLDVRYRRRLGWDGAGDSLSVQSIRPILDAGEMGSSAGRVRAHIAATPDLAARYSFVFKRPAVDTPDDDVLADAGKALAAYQETLVSPRTAFDDYRDRLTRAQSVASDVSYPAAAARGLKAFVGVGGCDRCHGGPTLGGDGFAMVLASPVAPGSSPDEGRLAGIETLRRNPFRAGSRFDDAARGQDVGTARADQSASVSGTNGVAVADGGAQHAFRVPSLRGVASTAPYMHDGSVPTLPLAVAHPVPALVAGGLPRRALTAGEIADLVTFLATLDQP